MLVYAVRNEIEVIWVISTFHVLGTLVSPKHLAVYHSTVDCNQVSCTGYLSVCVCVCVCVCVSMSICVPAV